MSIWFIADTHFCHGNIIKHCDRPFEDVFEMNEYLVARYNERVQARDTVYFVGDFGWIDKKCALREIFNRLNGKKILIKGNHDKGEVLELGWQAIYDYLKVKINGINFILFHYPIEEWDGFFRGSIHLHGHVHGRNTRHENIRTDIPNRFDVGVDNHSDYAPFHISEVLQAINYPVRF